MEGGRTGPAWHLRSRAFAASTSCRSTDQASADPAKIGKAIGSGTAQGVAATGGLNTGSNLAEPRVRAARRGSWNLECHAYSHPGFDRLAVQERRIVSPLHDGVRGRACESFVNDRVERGQADKAALFSDDTFQ